MTTEKCDICGGELKPEEARIRICIDRGSIPDNWVDIAVLCIKCFFKLKILTAEEVIKKI